ncbi:MAG: hypothetical protein AAF558_12330 [Verrucomicrobiota bacterium]
MSISEYLVFGAGLGQIILVGAGCCIPYVFNFRKELAPLSPLVRQLFWVYAAYILGANVFFALLCLLNPGAFFDQNYFATMMSAYLTLYWLVRIILNFTYFDRKAAPQAWWAKVGEVTLVITFTYLVGVYGYAFWHNISGS